MLSGRRRPVRLFWPANWWWTSKHNQQCQCILSCWLKDRPTPTEGGPCFYFLSILLLVYTHVYSYSEHFPNNTIWVIMLKMFNFCWPAGFLHCRWFSVISPCLATLACFSRYRWTNTPWSNMEGQLKKSLLTYWASRGKFGEFCSFCCCCWKDTNLRLNAFLTI